MVVAVRPDGTVSSTSRSITRCLVALCTSTSGASPVTVTVSSRAPTRISASIAAINEPVNSTPSRRNTLKPGRVKVTV